MSNQDIGFYEGNQSREGMYNNKQNKKNNYKHKGNINRDVNQNMTEGHNEGKMEYNQNNHFRFNGRKNFGYRKDPSTAIRRRTGSSWLW